jgi:hypothetical protein
LTTPAPLRAVTTMTTIQTKFPMRRTLAVAMLLLGTGLSGCVVAPMPRRGHENGGGVVVVEPPPVRMERPGPPPSAGYLWIDGFWNWSGGRHVWMPGHWEPRRDGHRWEPHRWERGHQGWEPRGGEWRRD